MEDLNLTLASDDDEGKIFIEPVASTSGAKKKRPKSAVSAIPSGSGLTFLLESSFEEDDDHDAGVDVRDRNVLAVLEEVQDNAAAAARSEGPSAQDTIARERELTDKYLAGQISFDDFVRNMRVGSEDEEEDDDDEQGESRGLAGDEDEEWRPSKKKSKSKKKSSPATPMSASDEEAEAEDHFEKFGSELDAARRQQLGKKAKAVRGGKSRKRRLDPALQGLMGEANLRFVRGDRDTAIRMCMEIIRQDPTAPEPFQTLSNLYEEAGESEKSLQFALIAAHLSQPQDPEEWARLADVALELGDKQQAAACYKKAISSDVDNVRYHLARCALLEELGEKTAALRGFRRLRAVLKAEDGEEFIHVSKEIARLLHERNEIEGAKDIIYAAVKKHPEYATSADINLLLELLITLGQYDEALEVVCQYCRAQFVSSESGGAQVEEIGRLLPEEQLQLFASIVVPEDMPMEIKSKLVVVLINLKASHLVVELGRDILSTDPEEFGDLILDVAEAFMSGGLHEDSLPFLKRLVDSEAYGKAAVFLRYGESLYLSDRFELAEGAFRRVVELAPQHHDARKMLSAILHKLGRPDEALLTLHQDEDLEQLSPSLLNERCQLLLAEGRRDEFVLKAKMLLGRHFANVRNKEELHAVVSSKRLSEKNKALSEVRAFMSSSVASGKEGPSFEKESEIPIESEYQLFRRLCDVLYEQGQFEELQKVAFSAMGSPYFNKKPDIMKECEFLCLLASLLSGDSFHAFSFARELVMKQSKNPRVWNLLNLVISQADHARHNKFLMRLVSRQPDNNALGILNGHNCLVSGTYKYSLGEYMSAFKQEPSNPLVALLLGITFVHMACQKFSAKKHSLVVQACAFLKTYLRLRGSCQESHYNVGRAMHQLGLLPAALHHYKTALGLKSAVVEAKEPNSFDLSREIAFNISRIYISSGSHDLARMYIGNNIIV